MTLAGKLALAMTAIVIAATAFAGFLFLRQISDAAMPLALSSFQATTGLMAEALESYVSASQEDVAALVRMPSVESFARLSASGTARSPDLTADIEAMIAGQFGAMMEAKPRYDQIRLIGTADDGREIVRVDSRGAGMAPERIPAAELQSKAARPYFAATLSLAPGDTYVSPLDYN